MVQWTETCRQVYSVDYKYMLCVCVCVCGFFFTSVGPCIVIYFYSKTNQTHSISNLFYFGTTLYMFQAVSPSVTWSLRLYIQHQVCTVLDSWWWMERPSETCTLLFQNKINLRYCASGWYYNRNILQCTVLQMSNNSSLLTTTFYSMVISTLVHSGTKYSVPFMTFSLSWTVFLHIILFCSLCKLTVRWPQIWC